MQSNLAKNTMTREELEAYRAQNDPTYTPKSFVTLFPSGVNAPYSIEVVCDAAQVSTYKEWLLRIRRRHEWVGPIKVKKIAG